MIGLISLDWCDDALEFGVVETLDKGELGLMSFVDPDFVSHFTCVSESLVELELLLTFCCANLSCFRNFARRFWNHTYKRNDFGIIWFDCENLIKCECMSHRLAPWWQHFLHPSLFLGVWNATAKKWTKFNLHKCIWMHSKSRVECHIHNQWSPVELLRLIKINWKVRTIFGLFLVYFWSQI